MGTYLGFVYKLDLEAEAERQGDRERKGATKPWAQIFGPTLSKRRRETTSHLKSGGPYLVSHSVLKGEWEVGGDGAQL